MISGERQSIAFENSWHSKIRRNRLTEDEKQRLVKENRWVVNDVISKYTHIMDRDDLEGAGLLGLIEGIQKYKTGKGAKISTYVRHWVRARVLAAVYENRLVHIPWNKINSYIKTQRQDTYDVSISGSNTSKSKKYNTARYNNGSDYTPKFEISLDAFSSTDGDDGDDNLELQSSLSSQDLHILEAKETSSHVQFALDNSTLSALERRAIDLRFGLTEEETPMTFSQVGALTGLSTMGAQKAVVRGLNKLKDDKIMQDLFK